MAAQLNGTLQLSGRELGVIINTIPALAWSARVDGSAETFSQQYIAYVGLASEQLQGWGWTVAVHPSDLSALTGTWQSIVSSGNPGEAEARLRRFDGEYRWFLFRANPMRDESGSIVKWFGINTDVEDRKRAEGALGARERDLRSIIDTIPALAWSADPNGYSDFLNQRWLDYTGMSAERAQGWGWRAAIHPDDVKGLVEHWQACLASGTPLEAEARLRRFDGVYRWFLVRANPSRDEVGNISKWYGTNTDIEDRRRGEEALRASELSWRQIVDNIPGLVATMGATGEVGFLNRQTLEYFGTTSKDLKNWALIGVVHPDDLPRVIEARMKSIEASQIYEVEHRCRGADGVFRWFQVRGLPVRNTEGAVASWYLLLTDIDERKQAEDKLRRSEAFLAEGQRLSRTGSFSWRVETGEITWSEALYRIFEFDRSVPVTVELIGTRVFPDDILTFNDVIERARAGLSEFEYEHRLLMPDQSIKFLNVTAHGSRDNHGRLEYIGAVQDITARRLAEEALNKARAELAHAARVMTLGALTASIAHEVNQPLSGIITNASTCLRMLAADPPNLDGARTTAQRTLRDGNRASEVIQRLRSLFARKQPKTELVDLNDAAREVLALSWRELQLGHVILRTEFDEGLPTVRGDRVQLQQVILNLILNAADAMRTVDDRPRDLLVATSRDDANQVRLSVCDVGVGIDPQNLEKLFDAFYTTKSHGMGVGLSISRSIIESHEGRLWASANDGPGATFSFSIPCR